MFCVLTMHELGMYVCSLLARMLNNCCDMKRAGLKHSWKCSKISAEKNIFFFSHTKSFEWIFMMGQNSAFPGAIFQLCLVASTKIWVMVPKFIDGTSMWRRMYLQFTGLERPCLHTYKNLVIWFFHTKFDTEDLYKCWNGLIHCLKNFLYQHVIT
jgi:hypothetical protein